MPVLKFQMLLDFDKATPPATPSVAGFGRRTNEGADISYSVGASDTFECSLGHGVRVKVDISIAAGESGPEEEPAYLSDITYVEPYDGSDNSAQFALSSINSDAGIPSDAGIHESEDHSLTQSQAAFESFLAQESNEVLTREQAHAALYEQFANDQGQARINIENEVDHASGSFTTFVPGEDNELAEVNTQFNEELVFAFEGTPMGMGDTEATS